MITLRNDPYFDEQAVVNRVKNLWLQLMTCRFSWDMEPLKPYFSDTLCAKEMDALKKDQESMMKMNAGMWNEYIHSVVHLTRCESDT